MGPFALAVPIIVVLSSVGALNAVIMGGSRYGFYNYLLYTQWFNYIVVGKHTAQFKAKGCIRLIS